MVLLRIWYILFKKRVNSTRHGLVLAVANSIVPSWRHLISQFGDGNERLQQRRNDKRFSALSPDIFKRSFSCCTFPLLDFDLVLEK
jgi:hypothetical protein